jgi:hypothetical protein
MAITETPVRYADASTLRVTADNAIEYAYRDLGESDVPLVLLQHFRGNLDNWDPALVDALAVDRRVLASSAPQGAAGMHGWAPEVIGAVGTPETSPQGYLDVFFAATDTSREAGRQAAGRIFGGRTTDPDEPTTWQTRQAQYGAVCAWGIPNHSLLERVSAIDLPVLVANGDSDPMILPRYSYLLAGLLPNARLSIYPDSAHGFLFRHHSQFAADVYAFLEGVD